MAEIPGAAGRLGICLPTAGAGGLDQHVMAEQLAPAAEPVAGVQAPKQYPFGAEPTGQVTLTL